MPLPLLLIPLAVAGVSALAQTVAKLKAHSRLNALRAELEQLESDHREQIQQHYDRQVELCRRLDLPEPELPPALREPDPAAAVVRPVPLWRRPLQRRRRTLADGPAQSRRNIVGRHAASFTAGTIWKTSSTNIMNLASPVTGRLLTLVPRIASVGGGAGGSIAASTGIRFALGAVSVVGIVLGPALAAVSIIREIRTVRKAQRELESTRAQRESELSSFAARTRQLQSQLDEAAALTQAVI